MPARTDRPSLGFGDDLDTFDPTEFSSTKPKATKPAPETSRRPPRQSVSEPRVAEGRARAP